MAGLLDSLFATPSDQALWALGSGLLGVRRGNEGRALFGAMGAYNDAQQEQRRNELVQLQKQMTEFQLSNAKRQRDLAEKEDAFYSNPANLMSAGQSAFPPNEMDAEGSPAAPPGLLPPQMIGQRMLQSGVPSLAKTGIGMLAKEDKETVMAPGSTLLRNGRPIYTAPDKAAQPPEIVRLAQVRDSLPTGHPMRPVLDAAITKATTHAPGTNVQFNTGEKGYKNSRDLASDFKAEPIYKAHMEVSSAYGQIKQGLASESPAGDLAAATKFMKLLDPGSVVRESELAMAMSATGLGDRIGNYVQMLVSGQKLTPAQRRDFRNMADRLYEVSEKLYRDKQANYRGIAKKYELDDSMLDLGGAPKPKPIDTVDDLVNHYTQEGQ